MMNYFYFSLYTSSHLQTYEYKKNKWSMQYDGKTIIKPIFCHKESQLQNKSSCPQLLAVNTGSNIAPVIFQI